jgi:hypothetical protein
MKLFLIQGTVHYAPYMGSRVKQNDIRIVWAKDECDARDKYHEYYYSKSEPHGDSYYADIDLCTEAIGNP